MINVILDSGAFSAWTKFKAIDLDDYIAFINQHKDLVDFYINLDVIPGNFGRIPTAEEVEESALAGIKNLEYMESKGLKPMPVFHQGEELKYLTIYIEKGYDYIGISPANDRSTKDKIQWLDGIFEFISDDKGFPTIKTHGFGVTALEIMFRYPWFSVDSASWAFTGAFGSILIPIKNLLGISVYNEPPVRIKISDRSPQNTEEAIHFKTMSPAEQKYVLDYIISKGFKLGVSSYKEVDKKYKLQKNERWVIPNKEVEVREELGVSNDHNMRDKWNIQYFVELEKYFQPWPWAFKPNKLEGFGL